VKRIFQYVLLGETFLEIQFTGHAICAISRDAVKKWTPRAWCFHGNANERRYVYRNGEWGCWAGCDNWFSYEMMKKRVPMHVDFSVFVRHDAPDYHNLLVGKEPPTTQFIPAQDNLIS
jgi:hypothetical protein